MDSRGGAEKNSNGAELSPTGASVKNVLGFIGRCVDVFQPSNFTWVDHLIHQCPVDGFCEGTRRLSRRVEHPESLAQGGMRDQAALDSRQTQVCLLYTSPSPRDRG